jgi:hypothetical protein
MNKLLSSVFIVCTLVFVYASASSAQCGGNRGFSNCQFSSTSSSVSAESQANYNKDTETLRAQLVDKNSEIQKEYVKGQPDLDKISKFQKDIIDIQTAMQKIALKYGITNAQTSCASGARCR